MANKLVVLCSLLVGAGLAGWLVLGGRDATPGAPQVAAEATYQELSFDALARAAEAVVVGEVVAVSPTRWNQDDGTFWEDVAVDARGRETSDTALPYYEIAIAPRRTLVDEVALAEAGGPLVVTVIGMSPAGGDLASTSLGQAVVGGGAEGPSVGQTIVAFARRTEMAWRGGTRPIVQLMGHPGRQIASSGAPDELVAPDSGEAIDLDDLGARVAAARASDR